jgi:alanine-glyoxylate transaminase/serine-glyoxylate transaminase/serine-pyruvate transaminase
MVTGTLTGIEMGLAVCGIPHRPGGGDAAMANLTGNARPLQDAAE